MVVYLRPSSDDPARFKGTLGYRSLGPEPDHSGLSSALTTTDRMYASVRNHREHLDSSCLSIVCDSNYFFAVGAVRGGIYDQISVSTTGFGHFDLIALRLRIRDARAACSFVTRKFECIQRQAPMSIRDEQSDKRESYYGILYIVNCKICLHYLESCNRCESNISIFSDLTVR